MKLFQIFLLVSIVFLSSCVYNPLVSPENERGLTSIETDEFRIELPENWIESSQAKSIIPNSWTIALIYESQESTLNFKNNIVIVSWEKKVDESSQALLKNTVEILKNNMTSFTPIKDETLEFSDGEKGQLLIFQGRYNTQTPELVYLQTARSCGDVNYYLTFSLGEVRTDYSSYEYILQSFSCR